MSIKKIALIYHGVDVDGCSSSALMNYYLKKKMIQLPFLNEGDEVKIVLLPWNYGFIFRPSYVDGCEAAFLLDIHFPENDLVQLFDCVKHVYIIDHHESGFELNDQYKEHFAEGSIYNNDHSGCMHTYNFVRDHLKKNISQVEKDRFDNLEVLFKIFEYWDIHTYLNLSEDGDITPQNVINISTYLNSIIIDPKNKFGLELWNNIFDDAFDLNNVFKLAAEYNYVGFIIYQSLQKRFMSEIKSYSFVTEFEGYKMLCANKYPGEGSNYFNEVDTKDADLLCTFYFVGKKNEWAFSIYVNQGRDITLIPIWEKYNHIRSGGHAKAGQFRCSSFQYDKYNKTIEFIF